MFNRWLLALIGVREDILRYTPSDRFRYLSMAGVLLTTATVAAVSAAFALRMAVGAPIWGAALLGIGWGIIILNLDRLLVIGMQRQRGFRRNLYATLPRVALAFLLGAVISTPLVLRIFDKEISAQVVVMQQQKEADRDAALTRDYADIVGLEEEMATLRAKAAKDPAAIESNPAVKQAKDKSDTADADLKEKAEAETCEWEGRAGCSTGVPGQNGIEYQARKNARERAEAVANTAKAELETAREQARATADIDAIAARAEIQTKQPALDQRLAQRQAARDNYLQESANSDGLLARIEALDALGASRPSIERAQLLLFLLFLTLELLPVLVKLMQLNGPPNSYERLSADQDGQEEGQARIEFAQAANARQLAAEREQEEQLRASLARETGMTPDWIPNEPPLMPNYPQRPVGNHGQDIRPDSSSYPPDRNPQSFPGDNGLTQPIPHSASVQANDIPTVRRQGKPPSDGGMGITKPIVEDRTRRYDE
ncbi:DUF4407 domain-containing protein [Nocardia salmonicida]|uniref:DUF4407 domain-containing protein n=1 Tax=Nocardia salmonicida TaxID=53431 RepID=UPI003403C4ED